MAAYLAETLYRKMRSDLEQRLILTDEKRLMTEPVLSKYYGVAVGTVRKAVSRLVEENLLERIQGSGTFLKADRSEVPLSVSPLRYSAVFKLHCQTEIDNCILDSAVSCRTHCFYGTSAESLEKEMREKDLLFFSPLQIFQTKQDDAFVPMPASFRKKVEADFAPEILDCFRSTAIGELFAVPIIANPEVIYLNTALLHEHHIEPPPHDWTWNDFLEFSRQLKGAGILPLLVLPVPPAFLEPFLKQAGGTLFNRYGKIGFEKEPFHDFHQFFRCFFEEDMIANAYLLPRSYPLEFGDRTAAMTVCHPYLGTHLPRERISEWSYWELPRHKEAGGVMPCFGLGVPCGARDPEAAWRYIETVVYERMSGLAGVNGVFPARRREQLLWKGAGLANAGAVLKEVQRASILPYKCGEYYKKYPLYQRLFAHFEAGTEPEKVRQELIRQLRSAILSESHMRE